MANTTVSKLKVTNSQNATSVYDIADAEARTDIAALETGKQDKLDSDQLAAVNSGITSAKVTQIETNKTNISSLSTTVSGHTTTLSQHTTAINNHSTTISNHTTQISTINTTLTSHGNSISSLQTTVTQHGTTLTQHGSRISALESAISGGTHFRGITRTHIKDGDPVGPVEVRDAGGSDSYGSEWHWIYDIRSGDFVVLRREDDSGDDGSSGGGGYVSKEFIAASGVWYELGSTGALGALAFKDSAVAYYTPSGSITTPSVQAGGTVSKPTFTGTEGNISATYTATGTIAGTIKGTTTTTFAQYTPEGTITKPTVTNTSTSGSAFASATYSSADNSLEFSMSSFVNAVNIDVAAPSFQGTAKAPTQSSGTCTITVNQTTDHKLTFTGTSNQTATGKFTPAGSVSQPTFTGTAHTHSSTFNGSGGYITVS